MAALDGPWDTRSQEFHGGQSWNTLDNFVEDFSVTTNGQGMPKAALAAAKEAVEDCHHYPPADQEPAKSSLAKFVWPDTFDVDKGRLLLGNGASELIDLVIRQAPKGTWKPGPWDVQYKEYKRSAKTQGREILAGSAAEPASLTCIVNPCNPTGDYMPVEELKRWIINNVKQGGYVIVDESMQPWHSPDFRSESLTSQREFVQTIYEENQISVYVIHSWTKLWSCTGLRLGSVVCPTREHTDALRKVQVPWSVNAPALAFLNTVVRDEEYLERTWKNTGPERKYIVEKIAELNSEWKTHGEEFLSWVWVDVNCSDTADELVRLAAEAGVPVRSGRPGYDRETFVRIAVRDREKVDLLFEAWRSVTSVKKMRYSSEKE